MDGTPVPRPLNPEYGPVITSAIRVPDSLDGHGDVGRGFYVEDGGNPQFLDWVVQASGVGGVAARAIGFGVRRTWAHWTGRPRANISRDISSLLGGGYPSANALPMLCMGRDVPNGTFRLRNGGLELDWAVDGSATFFDRVERTMTDVAGALGATLANTPMWLFKRLITVHPLGGVPMGATPEAGVVDPWGEVFSYPGMHVVDGSVMPGPVGPNPSLTIAAFAERAAAAILEGKGAGSRAAAGAGS